MGWVNNKGANSVQKFKDGGKVEKKKKINMSELRERNKSVKKTKKGLYEATIYSDMPTKEVGGEGGGKRRMYKTTAKSKDEGIALSKADLKMLHKTSFSPADSVVTGGKKKFKKTLKKEKRRK